MLLAIKHAGSFQEKSALLANYLLILYAFILPISTKLATKVFIGVAVFTLLSGNLKEKISAAVQNKVVLAFILFYLLHPLWMIGSEHLSTALFKLKEFKYILYIIVMSMIIKKEYIYKILGGFIIGIFFSEIVSYSIFFGLPVKTFFEHMPYISFNQCGAYVPFMENYTVYAISLSLTLGIILYRLFSNSFHNIYLILLALLFLVSATANIFLLESRTGYILYGLIIVFTSLLVFWKKKKHMLLIALIFFSSGYSAAYHFSPFFKQRSNAVIDNVHSALSDSYASAGGIRIGYYIYGWEIIKENPLFGVGTGDHLSEMMEIVHEHESNDANLRALSYNYHSGDNRSFDSEYLDTLIQFGIVGLIVLLNIFYQLIRFPQTDRELKFIQYLLAFSILIVAGLSLVFIPDEVGKIFVLLAALTIQPTTQQPKSSW